MQDRTIRILLASAVVGVSQTLALGSALACSTDSQVEMIRAAGKNNVAKVRQLRGCTETDINATGAGIGYTALEFAIRNKALAVALDLIADPKVDVNTRRSLRIGEDPRTSAPPIAVIFEYGPSTDAFAAKIVAALNKRQDFDPNLRQLGSSHPHRTPLLNALERGWIRTFDELLKNPKTNPNEPFRGDFQNDDQGAALAKASNLDPKDIGKSCHAVERLVNDSRTDLNRRASNGSKDVNNIYLDSFAFDAKPCLKRLVKQIFADTRFDANDIGPGWTAIMMVAQNGRDEYLPVLLKRTDVRINACSPEGKSALDYALQYRSSGHVASATILSAAGAKSCTP